MDSKRSAVAARCSAAVALCLTCMAAVVSAETVPVKHVFLWEVKSPQAGAAIGGRRRPPTTTVYLLGSIHMAKKSMYPLNPAIENAYAHSDVLVVEVNLNKVNQLQLAAVLLKRSRYPAGDSIEKHLDPETLKLLEARLKTFGLSLARVGDFKPWMIAQMLTALEMKRLGYDPRYGIDQHFLNAAARDRKDVQELESVKQQIDMLTGLPEKLQILMLKSTLLEFDKTEAEMGKMFKLWHDGDAPALQAELTDLYKQNPELKPVYKLLFDARNVGMAEKVEGYLKEKRTCFVIAGAGHMVGPMGIVSLLRKTGKYQITQVEQLPEPKRVAKPKPAVKPPVPQRELEELPMD